MDHKPDTRPNRPPKIAPLRRFEDVAMTTSSRRSGAVRVCNGGGGGRFGMGDLDEGAALVPKAKLGRRGIGQMCVHSARDAARRRIVRVGGKAMQFTKRATTS